jgi:hypothetical protein
MVLLGEHSKRHVERNFERCSEVRLRLELLPDVVLSNARFLRGWSFCRFAD